MKYEYKSYFGTHLCKLTTCLCWPLFQETSVVKLDRFYCILIFKFLDSNLEDSSVEVVYLRIVLSPEQASRMWVFLNKVFFSFFREGLLAPRPTPKLEDHSSSAVCDCLFNLFAATLFIGGRSSIRKLRTCHAVLAGTHYMALFFK